MAEPFRAPRGFYWGIALGLALVAAVFVLIRVTPALWADAEQARLCRLLIPALFDEADGITITGSESEGGRVVHIGFELRRNDRRSHLITCRFGGTGYSAAKRDLVSVQIDGTGIGETSFYFLKQKWLESPFAIAADPGPPRNGFPLLELERRHAVILQHVLGGLPRIGILSLLALATALIYGLTFRINLAFGEFAAMGGIACTLIILVLTVAGSESIWLASLLGLFGAILLGGLYGGAVGGAILSPLLADRAENRGGQPLLVAGVGLLILVQEGLRLAQGAGTLWLPPVGGGALVLANAEDFNVTVTPRLLLIALIDALAVLIVLIGMKKSRFGRAWRASADDPFAASLMGIDPRALLIKTSALATLLAALAGASIVINYGGIHFSGGTLVGLTALIAAILGGIGSLGGALAGALVIGFAQIAWSALQPIAHWELASFTLLTLALILRPGGFFGHADGAARKA